MSQSFTQRVSYISSIATLEQMLEAESSDHNRVRIIQAKIDERRTHNRKKREAWRRRHGYAVKSDYVD